MTLIKDLKRLTRIDDLIYRKATGTPEEFGKKLGLSERRAKKIIQNLRSEGVEIEYCNRRKTYKYSDGFKLFTEAPNLDKLNGGSITYIPRSQIITGHSQNFFDECRKTSLSGFSFV